MKRVNHKTAPLKPTVTSYKEKEMQSTLRKKTTEASPEKETGEASMAIKGTHAAGDSWLCYQLPMCAFKF